MPFVDGAFDNGMLLATIEHIGDTEALLGEIRRTVKRGGVVLISVTENDYHGSPMHVHVYEETALRETLRDFTVQCIETRDHVIYAEVTVR